MTNSANSKNVDFHLYDIVDDLVDNDLLGLLLSTNHFQKYCKIKVKAIGNSYSGILYKYINNPEEAAKFQQVALNEFKGLYISECRFLSTHDLAKDLDGKINRLSKDDSATEPYARVSVEIENSWKYRRACAGIQT